MKKNLAIGLAIVVVIGLGAVAWWQGWIPLKSSTDTTNKGADASKLIVVPQAKAETFATFTLPAVKVNPSVPAYSVSANMSNVTNASDFTLLTDAQKALLVKNAFVVTPSYQDEYFKTYEQNRYAYIPSFITTDSIIHTYHILFDDLLKTTEETKLAPALQDLTTRMLGTAQSEYAAAKGTVWENAAKRNVAFFAVAARLLDPSAVTPASVKDPVDQELTMIAAHDSVHDAVVMNLGEEKGVTIDTPQGPLSLDALKEDYSQYVPRGHYDKTDQLKRYFQTMMWYGRMTFRVKSPEEVRSAALMTLALADHDTRTLWNTIYEPTNFFVGKSDDITVTQFDTLLGQVYGSAATLAQMTSDAAGLDKLIATARDLPAPQINSIPVFQPSVQPDRTTEILGFRFMGQRFTIDASIFQRLLCREVGTNTGQDNCGGTVPGSRMLPKALDIPAAFGSKEAYAILDSLGETKYKNYPENMAKLQTYISGLDQATRTQNLYWSWLYMIDPLTQAKSQGYPSFMTGIPWQRKDLQTYLGSWTELKHDTILYAKQSYAELGGGPPEEKDDRGYVEPEPNLYARLSALSTMTSQGLELRGLLSDTAKDSLARMTALATKLQGISEKELANEALSAEDYEFIKVYGGDLEHLWLDVNQKLMDAAQETQDDYLRDNPAALVADVATDPNGYALEEATGKVFDIFVVVPVAGKLRLTKGAVFSHYEFLQPISDRLTDSAWRDKLASGDIPAQAAWTTSFTAQ